MIAISTTTTATAAVNPACLREIKDNYRELECLRWHARRLCSRKNWPLHCRRRMAAVLRCLRDCLAMHFTLEEFYGYFDEPVSVAPHLCERADALRAEHQALYLEVCDIVERAEKLTDGAPAHNQADEVVRGFREFDDELEKHEREERELMVQAFDEDLGVGD